jgi:hypothetical protein
MVNNKSATAAMQSATRSAEYPVECVCVTITAS